MKPSHLGQYPSRFGMTPSKKRGMKLFHFLALIRMAMWHCYTVWRDMATWRSDNIRSSKCNGEESGDMEEQRCGGATVRESGGARDQ
ncbi:hypothetical protein GUJ93_ZPchr0008g13440 [Zizania palustris]|uniref:Uncharacterized protein n=1 Tax=Zizania palustris TaxID=103762 RepID=A0A8J5RIJ8_ZIZPA|nr:hypothetical protein GUJ93_ZPchr0008g13440 [Zizania palustris]